MPFPVDEQTPRWGWLIRAEWRVAQQYGAELAAAVLRGEPAGRAMRSLSVMAERRAWTCLRWLRLRGQAVEFSGELQP